MVGNERKWAGIFGEVGTGVQVAGGGQVMGNDGNTWVTAGQVAGCSTDLRSLAL